VAIHTSISYYGCTAHKHKITDTLEEETKPKVIRSGLLALRELACRFHRLCLPAALLANGSLAVGLPAAGCHEFVFAHLSTVNSKSALCASPDSVRKIQRSLMV
jgi:hypothetical protein